MDNRGGELIRGRPLTWTVQAVLGALDFDQGDGHTGGAQTLGEFGGLAGAYHGVLGALQDQERRGTWGHVGDRAGRAADLDRTAETDLHHESTEGGRVTEVGEVGRPEHVDHGLDGAGLVEVLAAVESGPRPDEAEQRRKVPPTTTAPYPDPAGVDAQVGSVVTEAPPRPACAKPVATYGCWL